VLIDFIVGLCRYDCGVIVLKVMELWDGHKKYDGNSMPHYTNVSYTRLIKLVFSFSISV